jgi:hypothetical protein
MHVPDGIYMGAILIRGTVLHEPFRKRLTACWLQDAYHWFISSRNAEFQKSHEADGTALYDIKCWRSPEKKNPTR